MEWEHVVLVDAMSTNKDLMFAVMAAQRRRRYLVEWLDLIESGKRGAAECSAADWLFRLGGLEGVW